MGILKRQSLVKKLHKSLLQAKKRSPCKTNFEMGQESTVPEDVKEGHFAVIAADDNEERRFVVPLAYLGHPLFQILLERAAEEYGFDHDGALMVPCRPSELERILAHNESSSRDDVGWNSYNTMLESC